MGVGGGTTLPFLTGFNYPFGGIYLATLTQAQAEIAELALAVSYRPLSELVSDPKSARQHSKAQIKKLARSIAAFGFVMPILLDQRGGLIAGHARLLTAKQLGIATVPTVRLSELSTWDDRLLAESLQDLTLLNLDFLLELTGFDIGKFDLRIESMEIVPEQGRADPADAIAGSAGEPKPCVPARPTRRGGISRSSLNG